MAGIGKSAISRTRAARFKEEGLLDASFFFKRSNRDRGTAALLFTKPARAKKEDSVEPMKVMSLYQLVSVEVILFDRNWYKGVMLGADFDQFIFRNLENLEF